MKSANSDVKFPYLREPFILILLFAILFALPLSAQEAQEEATTPETEEIFTPFVSKIRTAVSQEHIRITWVDIPDIEGVSYRVYRLDREITPENIHQAELLSTVEAGEEHFLDTVDANGTYYYAIVAANEQGQEAPMLIPFRNKTILATVVNSIVVEEPVASVQSLTAESEETGILLNFISQAEDGELVVYRSINPLQRLDSLEGGLPIARLSAGSGSYLDEVIPGIPYYYAVLPVQDLSRDDTVLATGENTLARPVQLALGTEFTTMISGTRRGDSLPVLVLQRSVLNGANLPPSGIIIPEPQAISQETRDAVQVLLQPFPQAPIESIQRRVLAEESNDIEAAGQSKLLAEIVQSAFIQESDRVVIREVENLLTVIADPILEQRARFYYAQSLYFTGQKEAAYLQLLIIRQMDYPLISGWMNTILKELSE